MNDKWYLSGPLAIGTTEPRCMLHVEGDGIHSGGTLAGLSFQNRESPDFVDKPTRGERWLWYSSGGAARLWSGNDKLSISKEGNLGIGTADPKQRLHVDGNAVVNNVLLGNVGHGADWAGFSHASAASTAGYGFLHNKTGQYALINKKSGDGLIGFRIDDVDKMVIVDNGNVGIGANDPKSKLHISDPRGGNIKLFPGSDYEDFSYDGGRDDYFCFAHNGKPSGGTAFRHGDKELLLISNDGTIYIGDRDGGVKMGSSGISVDYDIRMGGKIKNFEVTGRTVPLHTQSRDGVEHNIQFSWGPPFAIYVDGQRVITLL